MTYDRREFIKGAWLRARLEACRTSESGLALLDLLLGMVIFALIAVIAVQAMGMFRERAYVTQAVSDVKQLASGIEGYATQGGGIPSNLTAGARQATTPTGSAPATTGDLGVNLSAGSAIAYELTAGGAYTACVTHPASRAWAYYESAKGAITGSGIGVARTCVANRSGADSEPIADGVDVSGASYDYGARVITVTGSGLDQSMRLGGLPNTGGGIDAIAGGTSSELRFAWTSSTAAMDGSPVTANLITGTGRVLSVSISVPDYRFMVNSATIDRATGVVTVTGSNLNAVGVRLGGFKVSGSTDRTWPATVVSATTARFTVPVAQLPAAGTILRVGLYVEDRLTGTVLGDDVGATVPATPQDPGTEEPAAGTPALAGATASGNTITVSGTNLGGVLGVRVESARGTFNVQVTVVDENTVRFSGPPAGFGLLKLRAAYSNGELSNAVEITV